MKFFESYLKRYDLEDLKQENKEYIFNNYNDILKYFNQRLKNLYKK